MKIALRRQKIRLSTLLEQRTEAQTSDERMEANRLTKEIANLVLKPLKLYGDADTPKLVAELAQGLADFTKAGRFGPEVSAIEAVDAVATERGLDPHIPAEVAERLSKLV